MPAGRLSAYLDRLRLDTLPTADAQGLTDLLAAHRQSIAFENLDVRLGRAILIDSDAVFDKLVTRRRGGYCFEQNRLFSDMLATLGLPNRPLLARVWLGIAPDFMPPRTHTLLHLELEGQPWIADAGFGGSFVPPMPLIDGMKIACEDGALHRLRRIGTQGDLEGEWLVERAGPIAAANGSTATHGDWQPQYSFDLSPVAPVDLEQANHWTSSRPNTRFTTLHVASIPLPSGFASLVDRTLSASRGGTTHVREIGTPADYHALLGETFGLLLNDAEIAALPLFSE